MFLADSGVIGFWDGNTVTQLPALDTIADPRYGYYFHKDKKGNTWLATEKGLFVLDMENGKVLERYWSGGNEKYYFPFDNIYHIHEDETGTFWIATGGTGLIRWKNPEGV